jgi:hypothetical protein
MNVSTYQKSPRTPKSLSYHGRKGQPCVFQKRCFLLGLILLCSQSRTIRTSYSGTFGTYWKCLRTQWTLEDPATQRGVTVSSIQTTMDVRNTHLSQHAKCMKYTPIARCRHTCVCVTYVTSSSSTLERLKLDYLPQYHTSSSTGQRT